MERMSTSFQRINTKETRFLDNQHQIDYDILKDAYEIVSCLSPKEFHGYMERIQRREEGLKQQTNLF